MRYRNRITGLKVTTDRPLDYPYEPDWDDAPTIERLERLVNPIRYVGGGCYDVETPEGTVRVKGRKAAEALVV